MFERTLRKIREAIRRGDYETVDPHVQEELVADDLTPVDAEFAILTGRITRRERNDPRGVRYTIVGRSTDGRTMAVIARIKETGTPLLITVYIVEEKTS